MTHFYVSQEKAMAPGSSGEWPRIIPKPGSPHGRLKRIDDAYETMQIAESLLMACSRGDKVPEEILKKVAAKLLLIRTGE